MKDKLKPGVRVVVIDEDHKLRRGTVKVYYDMFDIVLVKFDDGNVEKVPCDFIGIESDVQEDEKKEPREKDMITITPAEFKETGVKVIEKLAKKLEKPPLILLATIVIADLHKALFIDEGEDD